MRSRTMVFLAVWNVAITLLLITGVTAPSPGANAMVFSSSSGDPQPLNDGGDGSSATADDMIETTTPDALVAVATTGLSPKHPHICLVTASAEATFVADGTYVFGIALDGSPPTAASNRRIEMFNNEGIADDSFEEVTTTIAFANLSGDHTFTFSARKSGASDGNLNVSASSMIAVCHRIDL